MKFDTEWTQDRFHSSPRINRIRWDKPAAEADRIETLEKILERGEEEVYPLQDKKATTQKARQKG